MNNLLLEFSTLTWREVFIYLSSALEPVLTADAILYDVTTITDIKVVSVSSAGYSLPKGNYVLCPSSSSLDVKFSFNISDTLLPVTKLGSTASSNSTDSRSKGFSHKDCLRDGQCVISNTMPDYCQAAHIVPHCFKDSTDLPKNVRDILDSNGINSVQNGLLLDVMNHKKFDSGCFAVKVFPTVGAYILLCFSEDH